eukprot:4649792-Ditylum_brightwellii.AAC.1
MEIPQKRWNSSHGKDAQGDYETIAHVTPNVILYNMLLKAYAKRSCYDSKNVLNAEKLFNWMNTLSQTGINTEATPD